MGTQKTRVKLIGSPVKSKQDTNMAKGLVRKRKGGKERPGRVGGEEPDALQACKEIPKSKSSTDEGLLLIRAGENGLCY